MGRKYNKDLKQLDGIELSIVPPKLEGFDGLDWGLQAMVKKTTSGAIITNRNVPRGVKMYSAKTDAEILRYFSEGSDPYWTVQPKHIPRQLPYLYKTLPELARVDLLALDVEKEGDFTFFLFGLKSKIKSDRIIPFEEVMYGRKEGDVQVSFHRLFVYRLDMMRNDYFMELTLSFHRLKKDAQVWIRIPVPDWKTETEEKEMSHWERQLIGRFEKWKDPNFYDAGELKTALYLDIFGKRTDKEFDPTSKAYEKFSELKSIYLKAEAYMPLSVLSVFLAFGFWYHTVYYPDQSLFERVYGACFDNWDRIWNVFFDKIK